MKKTMKTLVVLGASIVLLGSQVCFAGSQNQNRTWSVSPKTNRIIKNDNGTRSRTRTPAPTRSVGAQATKNKFQTQSGK